MDRLKNTIIKTGASLFTPLAGLANGVSRLFSNKQPSINQQSQVNQNQVNTTSAVPTIITPNPNPAPKLAPIVPQTTTPTPTPFKLDMSNITDNHLGGSATTNSVLSSLPSANPYADALAQYNKQVEPFQQQELQSTMFSPDYIAALNKQLNTNQGFRAGIQNIRGRAEPLDFQQGQEAALTRDTALTQQADAENLALQEMIRQNNIQTAQTGISQAQNTFQNTFNAQQGNLNYLLGLGGLGVQQQQTNQGRYEYQQITDPNTGFPTIQILDRQSGLPVGNVSPGSPMGQQIINSGAMVTGGQNNGVINGYNITTYATDPNHEQAVSNWYQAINNATQQIGGITDANTAQAVIAQLAPNSPITGQMIINAAQKYGVDPALMISIMQQDSQLGTKGLATKTFNPGNVGNDGKSIKNMGSWDKGVESVAQWLSTHRDNGQASNQTSTGATSYQSVVSNAPSQLQSAIKPLPDGSAYIDSSLLSRPEFGVLAQQYASKNGLRVLSGSDAEAINTVTQSIKNMQTLANTFSDLAPKTGLGAKVDTVRNPVSKLFNTDFGAQLISYQANREGLFQQIRALAGSSPRLNGAELNTAASSMPVLSDTNKDTLKVGINKLVKTQSYLDNAIRTFIPGYVGTPVTVGNQFAVLANDGKAYLFPSNESALQFLKAQK